MGEDTDSVRDLNLLEEIERDPDITQASLATRLGVAVGTVNWHLKRLIAKGYVKVKKAERRKLRYLITPEGISLRAKLTVAHVENSMALYRQTREKAIEALAAARREGHASIQIAGEGDIADVCRLTCLEQGFSIMGDGRNVSVPVLEIDGLEISLRPPARE
ncbi:MAG: winged helix-turn-helix transcriptional regulator [Nitrospiraceae bacterium]